MGCLISDLAFEHKIKCFVMSEHKSNQPVEDRFLQKIMLSVGPFLCSMNRLKYHAIKEKIMLCTIVQVFWKLECIPVGCVPSAAVAVCGGDVCPGECVSASVGPARQVSAWGVCLGICPGGCLPGGCLPGGCLPGGVCLGVSALIHTGIHTCPLWTE